MVCDLFEMVIPFMERLVYGSNGSLGLGLGCRFVLEGHDLQKLL
jgi:hypothetical protein